VIRRLLVLIFNVCALAALARSQSGGVQTVGDVSFAVPDGWAYTVGPDFGAMVYKQDNRFWLVSVYTSMPSSGDPNADFKAAWRRVVLSVAGFKGVPGYNPYSISKPLGYSGVYYDDFNTNNTAYARLYALETGKGCIPVVFISGNRQMLDGMGHMEAAIVGSVRATPAKATPIQLNIKLADLAGDWTEGLAFSTSYYSRSSGQYVGSQQTFYRADYSIAASGRYTYKMGGMNHNVPVTDNDTGMIGLGDGFVSLKGQRYQRRYRFVFLVQAIDGSTVLGLFPDVDMAQINSSRDLTFWTRPVKK
jgi:hypothetical protein